MPKHPAEQEKGHLYGAEKPSSYHKGQLGKGVSIGGKVTAKGGEAMQVDDSYAHKLRGIWSQAMRVTRRFPSFK